MKTQLKYLLLGAMAAFFFLNISGKVDKRQSGKRMPQIPNGDFEDKTSKSWEIDLYSFTDPDPYYGQHYTIVLDSINKYHGKYCAFLGCNDLCTTTLKNKFAISVHPASLHIYAKGSVSSRDALDKLDINVKLLKNSAVVDSGFKHNSFNHNPKSMKQWTEITIPITHKAAAIDSALIIITSELDTATDKLWIDDLFFK